jgi:hypothetical protein
MYVCEYEVYAVDTTTHIHTYIRACIQTYTHTYIHKYIRIYIHTCKPSIHPSIHHRCQWFKARQQYQDAIESRQKSLDLLLPPAPDSQGLLGKVCMLYVCAYIYYFLTDPPIPCSPCNHMGNLHKIFFLHRKRGSPNTYVCMYV